LHPPFVEKRVLGQFAGAKADTNDPRVWDFGRQMAHPSRHQIEDGAAGREDLAIEIGDGGDRHVVDIPRRCLRPRRRIELLITIRGCSRRKDRHFPLSSYSRMRWGLPTRGSIAEEPGGSYPSEGFDISAGSFNPRGPARPPSMVDRDRGR